MPHPRSTTTIAILGGNPVTDNALSLLLRGEGYEVTILEDLPADKPLADVDLLILASSLSSAARADLLRAVRDKPGTARMPVLILGADMSEASGDGNSVPVAWPVHTGRLVQQIEAVLERRQRAPEDLR